MRVRRRSLAGPIVLITIGMVFLLGNLGYLTWHSIGTMFAHYWPVLIILWGTVKLLEYYQAQREGYAAPGIGAGGIVLLVFLIMCGLIASQVARVNWSEVGKEINIDDELGGIFGPYGTPYNYTDQMEQTFSPGNSLRVVSDRGAVTVLSWDQEKIKVSIRKKVYASSEGDARGVNENTRPTLSTAGNVVTLNANTGAAGGRRVETNFEVYLPKKAPVEVATSRGDVAVRGRDADVKLATAHGNTEVSDIGGNVNISLRGGSARAEKVSGDVSLAGRVDDTTFANIGGNLRLSGDFFGTMNVSKVAKSVHFTSSRTDMELARLDGDLTMESGEMRAKSLAGPVRIVTRSKDIRLEDVTGDVKVEDTNAEIEVHAGKLPVGNISIDNRKGRIQVVLPAKSAFQVSARATRGDIQSDFPELKVQSSDRESTASGSVGTGGGQIRLSTEHGDIEIRKGG